jgi:F-type H+-transporting ATPase subunit epsilon
MARPEHFHLSVITPERVVLEADAQSVVFPAHDGEVGVLPHHAPLLYKMGIGTLRFETAAEHGSLFVDGGFAQFVGNRLTILTEAARRPSEVDRDAAERALTEARAMEIRDDASYDARQKALSRARTLLHLAGPA